MKTKYLFMATLCLSGIILGSCEKKSNKANSEEPEIVKRLEIVGGVLPGTFSTSANQKVQFSQGNLQYLWQTDTWRFAEQQYDTIGDANKNISSSCSNWIDLFGWGTGYNPTKTDTDYKKYSYFNDWGLNPISNGGNKANTWRTLSKDEWDYLFNNRTNARNLRGCAKVNNKNGYILLPDNFVLPNGVSFQADAKKPSENTYTINQWIKMEIAGAVFLPNAGSRYNTEISDYECNYWSSTPNSVSGAINGEAAAYYMNFSSLQVGYILRTYGLAVRLVKDVQ